MSKADRKVVISTKRKTEGDRRVNESTHWPEHRCRRKRDRRGYLKELIVIPEPKLLQIGQLMILEKNMVAGKDLVTALVFTSGLSTMNMNPWNTKDIMVLNRHKDAIMSCQHTYYRQMVVNLDVDFTQRMAFVCKVLEDWPETKIIVTSLSPTILNVAIARENGIKHFMAKPYQMGKMAKLLIKPKDAPL